MSSRREMRRGMSKEWKRDLNFRFFMDLRFL
jgi:hypothetical protein